MSQFRKLRVLFIERNVDGTVGGSHRVLLEVIRHLDRTRFDPIVLFYERHSLIHDFEKSARVLVFPNGVFLFMRRWPNAYRAASKAPLVLWLILGIQKSYNFLRYAFPAFLSMIGILLRERIDIVCINNAPFLTEWLLASRLLGRKCISYFRGTPPVISKWKGWLFSWYTTIISISEAVTRNALEQGANVNRFMLIYDGIDGEAIRRRVTKQQDEVRKEFIGSNGHHLIGLVNNIKEWKGQHVAIEAMRILIATRQDIFCLLIGDVSNSDKAYAEMLSKRVHEYGLSQHIRFTGKRTDVPNLLIGVDLVLHTSLANEGFPRVILEAMILGRPIIASRSGPNIEMIEDGISGYLVEPGNPIELADRIQGFLADGQLRMAIGKRAQARAEQLFSIESNVRKTEELFLRATNSKITNR